MCCTVLTTACCISTHRLTATKTCSLLAQSATQVPAGMNYAQLVLARTVVLCRHAVLWQQVLGHHRSQLSAGAAAQRHRFLWVCNLEGGCNCLPALPPGHQAAADVARERLPPHVHCLLCHQLFPGSLLSGAQRGPGMLNTLHSDLAGNMQHIPAWAYHLVTDLTGFPPRFPQPLSCPFGLYSLVLASIMDASGHCSLCCQLLFSVVPQSAQGGSSIHNSCH